MKKIIVVSLLIGVVFCLRTIKPLMGEETKTEKQEKKVGKLGKTVPELIDLLKTGKESSKGFYILDLGFSKDERALVPLVDILLKDKNPRNRKEAAMALEYLGNKQAVIYLQEALKDKDERVQIYSAKALTRLGELKYSIKILKDLAKEGYAEAIDAFIIDYTTGTQKEKGRKLIDKKANNILIEALNYENEWVRIKSAFILSEVGKIELGKVSAEIIALCKKSLEESKDKWIKYFAADILGNIRTDDSVSILKKCLNDKDTDLVERATKSLKKIGYNSTKELKEN